MRLAPASAAAARPVLRPALLSAALVLTPLAPVHDLCSGHHGCVNRLCWNESGSLLASGSDDRKVGLQQRCGLK